MGARGPSKKSTSAKALDNPSKRPFGSPTELELCESLPTPPTRLGDEARALWDGVGRRLVEMNMLTRADLIGLECYCNAWQDYLDACSDIKENGYSGFTDKGYEYVRPSVMRRETAMKALKDWGRKFGFTPLDRANVELPIRGETEKSSDPLADSLPSKSADMAPPESIGASKKTTRSRSKK